MITLMPLNWENAPISTALRIHPVCRITDQPIRTASRSSSTRSRTSSNSASVRFGERISFSTS